MAYSPLSANSGNVSSDDNTDDHLIPTNLIDQEIQLALNKEATESELEKAVIKCKELVLECENFSAERKWLVRHLIELKLRLQECREAKLDPEHPINKSSGVSKRTIRGHHFQLQPFLKNAYSKDCDHCTGTIWQFVQAWYLCNDCGFNSHHKCLNEIIRECAHVTASEKGGYELDICPEQGLSAQKYICAECGTDLHVGTSWADSETRRCDYTGLYYCSACHWNGSAVIPARVTHNWDFNRHPVAQASLQLLKVTAERPLINLEKLNPTLFTLVHELSLVKRTRIELNQMRKYLLACRNAQQDHLLWKTVDTPHLIECTDLYSLADLYLTYTGDLPSKLLHLASVFIQHIKESCELCKGRGHICEICSNDEVLYPFDASAIVCNECSAVLHKICFSRKKNECPKCKRLQKRREKQNSYTYDEEDEAAVINFT